MPDYIDREAAIKAITAERLEDCLDSLMDGDAKRYRRAAERILAYVPAADVAPVKHGEWLEAFEPCGWLELHCVQCSACGESLTLGEWEYEDFKRERRFCPFCGAKMRG